MTAADEARFLKFVNLVDRMNDNLSQLNASAIILQTRINDLEVKLENLRVQSKSPNGTCNWGDSGCYNCPA